MTLPIFNVNPLCLCQYKIAIMNPFLFQLNIFHRLIGPYHLRLEIKSFISFVSSAFHRCRSPFWSFPHHFQIYSCAIYVSHLLFSDTVYLHKIGWALNVVPYLFVGTTFLFFPYPISFRFRVA